MLTRDCDFCETAGRGTPDLTAQDSAPKDGAPRDAPPRDEAPTDDSLTDAAPRAGAAMRALTARLLAVRAARSPAQRTAAACAIAEHAHDHLAVSPAALDNRLTPAAAGRTVAAYLSVGSEPPTGPLLEALAEAGVRVIVPVLGADAELDWAQYTPGDPLRDGLRRTVHPHGPTLGADALRLADTIIVPALAVDRRGRRLGRGGGSYDRALARLFDVRSDRSAIEVLAVVYDDEVLDEVPTQPHDRPVDGALTPSGL